PQIFRKANGLATVGPALGTLALALFAGRRKRSSASTAHGSSRWATTKELARAGILGDAGVVLCQTTEATYSTRVDRHGKAIVKARRLGRLVRHNGPEHVFCFAPTRSGKGVGLVIPTLVSWPHSVLVYDIKKENWS